jgi:hypothetical protein
VRYEERGQGYGDVEKVGKQWSRQKSSEKSRYTHRVTMKQGSYSGAKGHLACREIPSLTGPRRFITVVT